MALRKVSLGSLGTAVALHKQYSSSCQRGSWRQEHGLAGWGSTHSAAPPAASLKSSGCPEYASTHEPGRDKARRTASAGSSLPGASPSRRSGAGRPLAASGAPPRSRPSPRAPRATRTPPTAWPACTPPAVQTVPSSTGTLGRRRHSPHEPLQLPRDLDRAAQAHPLPAQLVQDAVRPHPHRLALRRLRRVEDGTRHHPRPVIHHEPHCARDRAGEHVQALGATMGQNLGSPARILP
jgi:hypothetical protein